MFRRPPEFKIDPELNNPFHADRLGREESIRNLTKLMQGTATPMVMTVSAPWGSGKSSFIKMWKAFLMEDEGGDHPCILFDAWKHDFHKEPLLSFMGELGAYMGAIQNPCPQLTEQFERCLNAAPPLLNAVGALSSLAAAADSRLTPIATFMVALGNTAGKVKKYITKDYALQKSSIDNFTNELKAFVKMLLDGRDGNCLYFFIDELDRCDPEYAIKLLESIKHFFHIPGIVFVLSVDRDKLGSMVRVRYGDNYDADGYLKRFVDVDYQIPEPEREQLIRYLCSDVVNIENYPVGSTEERYEEFVSTSLELANDLDLGARDIEKVLIKLTPFLSNDFSLLDEETFKMRHNPDGSQYLAWVAPEFFTPVSRAIDAEWLSNFYYPLLIFAFLKEKSRKHYERCDEMFKSSVPDDLVTGCPHSRYLEVIKTFSSSLASCNNYEVSMAHLKKYGEDKVGNLCKVGVMLGANSDYWGNKKNEIRAQLDSLDNITFLNAEDSTDNSDAA